MAQHRCYICGGGITELELEETHKGQFQIAPCYDCRMIAHESVLEMESNDEEDAPYFD